MEGDHWFSTGISKEKGQKQYFGSQRQGGDSKTTAKHMRWGDKNLYKGGDGKEEINIKDIIEEDMQNLDFACEGESGRSQALTALIKISSTQYP